MQYYNETSQQYEELSIKALDSMPVGTVVEYTGTDIPNGWEQVNDYSTTEIDTGKRWVNGRKIYRRVFLNTTASSTGTEKVIGTVTGMVLPISFTGVIDLGQYGYSNIICTYNSSNIVFTYIDSNKNIINQVNNGAYTDKDIWIIVEYIKSS